MSHFPAWIHTKFISFNLNARHWTFKHLVKGAGHDAWLTCDSFYEMVSIFFLVWKIKSIIIIPILGKIVLHSSKEIISNMFDKRCILNSYCGSIYCLRLVTSKSFTDEVVLITMKYIWSFRICFSCQESIIYCIFKRELTPLCVAFVRPSHFNSVDALKNGTEGNGFNSLTMSKKLHTHQ